MVIQFCLWWVWCTIWYCLWVVAVNVEVGSSWLSPDRSEKLLVPVLGTLVMIFHQVWFQFFCCLHNDTWLPQFCTLVLCVDMLTGWQWCMLLLVQLVMTYLYSVHNPGVALRCWFSICMLKSIPPSKAFQVWGILLISNLGRGLFCLGNTLLWFQCYRL